MATPVSERKLKQATLPFKILNNSTSSGCNDDEGASPAKKRKLSDENAGYTTVNLQTTMTHSEATQHTVEEKKHSNRSHGLVTLEQEQMDIQDNDENQQDRQTQVYGTPEKVEIDENEVQVVSAAVSADEESPEKQSGDEMSGDSPTRTDDSSRPKKPKMPPGSACKREELRKHRQDEKEKKERERKEQRRIKEEELRQRREEKEKKEREKEELKKKKEEELRLKKEQKEKERLEKLKQKEDEKKKKEEEKNKKIEEKQKQEEEKLKQKEESEKEKAKEKEAEMKKKEKQANLFSNFFTKVERSDTPKAQPAGPFMQFEVKKDMQLAPVHRCATPKRREARQNVEHQLADTMLGKSLYLEELKLGLRVPCKFSKTISQSCEEDDVVIVLEDGTRATHRLTKVKFFKFSENNRPAYYGTFRKKSKFINPRNPLRKDEAQLDYEVDSDDDWEEEDPGESVSTDESDNEEETEKPTEDDEDDGFFVPHGYLSEGEGCDEEDDDMTPDRMKARQLAKARAFEDELKRKTEVLKPICVGPIYMDQQKKANAALYELLQLFKMVALVDLPIKLIDGAEAAKKDKKKVGTPHPQRQPVPEQAIPELLRLIHGNSKSIHKIYREFGQYWWRKSNNMCMEECAMEAEETSPNNNEAEASDEALKKCGFSKRQLLKTIKSFAVYEKRDSYNLSCWYVHREILKRYEMEGLPVPTQWQWITKVITKPSNLKYKKAAEQGEVVVDNTLAEPVSARDTPKASTPSILQYTRLGLNNSTGSAPSLKEVVNNDEKSPFGGEVEQRKQGGNPQFGTVNERQEDNAEVQVIEPPEKPQCCSEVTLKPQDDGKPPSIVEAVENATGKQGTDKTKWKSTPIGKLLSKLGTASPKDPHSHQKKLQPDTLLGSSEKKEPNTNKKLQPRVLLNDLKKQEANSSKKLQPRVLLHNLENKGHSSKKVQPQVLLDYVQRKNQEVIVIDDSLDAADQQMVGDSAAERSVEPGDGKADKPMEID